MRRVVCNTTPILSLLKIGHLRLLNDMYGTIIIPHAVYDEIEVGKNREYYTDLRKENWITIQKINDAVALDPKIIQQAKELAGEI